MEKITETMLVCQVLELHPEFENIFMAHGLNCAGCPGASMESIREAAEGHGIDMNALLDDLNEKLQGASI